MPQAITRCARRAVRGVCSGERTMAWVKRLTHKADRRSARQALGAIRGQLFEDIEEFDLKPSTPATGRDIW